ncbi:DUF1330 domain-containing protein [Sphingomonas sp. SUN039]|uniref:DUF1330 domain-containing protein n=1 Tax=Sphingomonas sp. SUN039 TaxID=2937787 RepID=UPI002164E18C|nr:DUF1330 domain-containing protein [Sphingomonas sp. SUN039]UVO54289.1 DUF1330 domain-containing protein [Sphingomonas sp. SUN039]
MPAYALFIREGEVSDPEEMAKYQAMNRAGTRPVSVKPLIVYGAMETLEGAAPDGIVLLEFPTMADAKAWYHSDAYQAAAAHRKSAAPYRAIFVEGLG